MDKRWIFFLLMVGTFGDACGTDESGTNDGGGIDASVDVTNDVVKEAAPKDAAPEADVIVNTCDGGTACGAPTDCPATTTVCIARTCADGCCGTAPAAVGVPCTEDGGTVCDGTGVCVACNQPTDCKASTTCVSPGCSGNTCSFNNVAIGTSCLNDAGGKVCDGTGSCVECNQPSDCPTPTTTCATAMCSTGHTCGTNNTAVGTICNDNNGHVCNGAGSCVKCNFTTDCLFFNDAGTLACVNNTCI